MALILAAGCQDVAPVPGKLTTPLQYQHKVIAKDFVLHDWMRIAKHKAERTPTDLLRIRLAIENIEDDDVWCDIQVVFYDDAGFEIEKTNWAPLLLIREQITFYDTVSLSPNAHDYTVFLRDPRETKDN